MAPLVAVPARFVHLGMVAASPVPSPIRPAPALDFAGTVMVLEDSALLAMDAEDILRGLGFRTVEVVGTAPAALDLLRRVGSELTFALLDVNLSDHTSLPVAEELLRRGIPFAFATGYGKGLELPPALAAAAMVIPKPYRRQDIADLIGQTLQRH